MHTWVIQDFEMCFHPTKSEPVIRSPWFYSGNPPHSVWRLELYSSVATADKRTIQYSIDFLSILFRGDYTSKVLLVGPDGKTQKVKLYSSLFPSLNEDLLPIEQIFLPRGTLTLKFSLTFKIVPTLFATDLTDLSQQFLSLYGNEEFSDLTLYKSKKEFFIHKFLLRLRAPELFNVLGLRSENLEKERVKVDSLSTPVLQTVLKYVYTGKLDSLPEKYLPELYETLKKYEFTEFDKEILRLKPSSTIRTHIKVEHRDIWWYINKSLIDVEESFDDLDESSNVSKKSLDDSQIDEAEISIDDSQNNEAETSSDESFADCRKTLRDNLPVLKHVHIDNTRLLIKILFSTGKEESVHINIRCVSSLEDDILLKCTTSLGMKENKLITHSGEFLLFSNEKMVHYLQSHSYCQDSSSETLILHLNLVVCKGGQMCSVDGAVLISPEEQSMYGMNLLSYQLQKLVWKYADEEDINEMGDVTINFENGPIKAHKSILALCSPHFKSQILNMIKKNSNEIDIPDMDIETGKSLLRYIYCRRLTERYRLGYFIEEDMKLYVAAKKYQLFSLFRKCSKLLVSHLSSYNACEMLVLANNNNDEPLLQEIQSYIESHRDILNSAEWISLVNSNKNHLLVSRILTYISRASIPASQK